MNVMVRVTVAQKDGELSYIDYPVEAPDVEPKLAEKMSCLINRVEKLLRDADAYNGPHFPRGAVIEKNGTIRGETIQWVSLEWLRAALKDVKEHVGIE